MKNMIHLSNLNLHDASNLISRKDLHDSAFQDTIMKVLCLGKCFQILINEKSGLNEGEDLPKHLNFHLLLKKKQIC